MSETPLERLHRKLDEAFAEPWGDLALRVELDPETHADPATGGVTGGATFLLVDRSGNGHPVHRAEIAGLATAEAVDDWLGEVLSTLLAGHPGWPRRAAGG